MLLCFIKPILGIRYGMLLSGNFQLYFSVENGANFFVVDRVKLIVKCERIRTCRDQ